MFTARRIAEWVGTAVDLGDASALVSATQPRTGHTAILKNADAPKTVEVENANAWALLEEEDVDGAECDGSGDAEGPDQADPLWSNYAKMSADQEERSRQLKIDADAAKVRSLHH